MKARRRSWVRLGLGGGAMAALGVWAVIATSRGPAVPATVTHVALAPQVPQAVVPAPAPAPVAAPAPKPVSALLRIESDPVGAVVRRAGDAASLGTTPFQATLPLGDLTLAFEKSGYRDHREAVSLQGDRTIRVTLVRKVTKAKKSSRKVDQLTTEL